MSGHSKWANIKQRKGKQDAIKGAVYTKLSRAITMAAKDGGDPRFNAKLYDAIQKAKAANMPNDNIERAVKKGTGDLEGKDYEEITYEGYGPGGVAVILDILTDNRNRTAGDVRHLFDKFGGSMGENGCVSWMFDKKGVILVENNGQDEDEVMMVALDAGANDMEATDDGFEISVEPADLMTVKTAVEEAGYTVLNSMVSKFPQNMVELDDAKAVKMTKLLDAFEEHDDVQDVYHNWDQPEEEDED